MTPKIAVLTVGTELLNGEVADTNTRDIALALGRQGLSLSESMTVPDVEGEIAEALSALARRRGTVIVSGGLGPTVDDLTARGAARAFGRRLVLQEQALDQVRDFFRRTGRTMHGANEKQALLPQKALILPNPLGSAPGFRLREGECDLFFLPGVPAEMAAMLEASVLPVLQERGGLEPVIRQRVLKLFGLAEARADELLRLASLPAGVAPAFTLDYPLVVAKLVTSEADGEALLDRAELAARRALGDAVVALGDQTLPGNAARLLAASGLTLALAESCTGGLISKLLTDIPGASAFLERGAVTYADSAKRQWLGVTAKVLEERGAVSEACALAMARGMKKAARTDLALAVTGIAGPDGGTPEKPVGTVFIALASAEGVEARAFRFAGDRCQVRLMAACTALDWLRRTAAAHLEKAQAS